MTTSDRSPKRGPTLPVLPQEGPVGQAYAAWAAHYESCSQCQTDDWYEPFLGEPLFCVEGQQLFRAWVRSTATTTPVR